MRDRSSALNASIMARRAGSRRRAEGSRSVSTRPPPKVRSKPWSRSTKWSPWRALKGSSVTISTVRRSPGSALPASSNAKRPVLWEVAW